LSREKFGGKGNGDFTTKHTPAEYGGRLKITKGKYADKKDGSVFVE
jgi:hypothetical protein